MRLLTTLLALADGPVSVSIPTAALRVERMDPVEPTEGAAAYLVLDPAKTAGAVVAPGELRVLLPDAATARLAAQVMASGTTLAATLETRTETVGTTRATGEQGAYVCAWEPFSVVAVRLLAGAGLELTQRVRAGAGRTEPGACPRPGHGE
ncbi:MAG: hypothetical protein FJ090_16055 [Deltaproteobacteria bacterium]|nr:hypothetical protein [Deltaproteobacteria bacterium]